MHPLQDLCIYVGLFWANWAKNFILILELRNLACQWVHMGTKSALMSWPLTLPAEENLYLYQTHNWEKIFKEEISIIDLMHINVPVENKITKDACMWQSSL